MTERGCKPGPEPGKIGTMIKPPAYKTHLFLDCTSFGWRTPEYQRIKRISPDIKKCTCGACKARVLSPIQKGNWAKLDAVTLAVLSENLKLVMVR